MRKRNLIIPGIVIVAAIMVLAGFLGGIGVKIAKEKMICQGPSSAPHDCRPASP